MILYSRRSAKSVACSRLKVIGVSAFFFFPVFVAAFTSADEFHSVTNTRWPSALSHFASNPSCVVFPEPSIPSTTNSLPGYSCGCVRVFNISVATDLESQRLTGHSFKRRRMPRRSPELELGVARRPQLQQVVVAAIVQLQAADRLRVAAIQTLGEPQNCGKRAHRPPRPAGQPREAVVFAL